MSHLRVSGKFLLICYMATTPGFAWADRSQVYYPAPQDLCVTTERLQPPDGTNYYLRLKDEIAKGYAYLKSPSGHSIAGCSTAQNHHYQLMLSSGTYSVLPPTDPSGTSRAILITNQPLPANRRMILRGAGMNHTTISVPKNSFYIFTDNVSRLTLQDLHFTQTGAKKVSQGVVKRRAFASALNRWYLDIAVDRGFPTPAAIDGDTGTCRQSCDGKYLKRYVMENGKPQIVHPENYSKESGESLYAYNRRLNSGVPWTHSTPEIVAGQDGVYRVYLSPLGSGETKESKTPHIEVGDRIAVKSKHGSTAYMMKNGTDISYVRVRWTQEARGAFINVQNVKVIGCEIQRMPNPGGPIPALATSSGGPQIGGHPQYDMYPTGGHLVQGNRFIAPGDDGIAMFYASGGRWNNTIQDNYVESGFDRGVLVFDSRANDLESKYFLENPTMAQTPYQYSSVYLVGNNLNHNPIMFHCNHPTLPAAKNCRGDTNPHQP